MAVASSSSLSSQSTAHLLHHFFRPPPQPPLLSFLSRPLHTTTTKAILSNYQKPQLQNTSTILFSSHFFSRPTRPLLSSRSLSTSSLSLPPKALNHSLCLLEEEDVDEDGDIDGEMEYDDEDDEEEEEVGFENRNDHGNSRGELKEIEMKERVPNLTVKEKKELASYARGLGKKLKCQLVGKSGVTDGVVSSFIETLEANELLKIKIHRTCPGELENVVQQLEEVTGSVVVGQIGRTIIIYRPSLTKLKAEDKKKQARKVFVRKQPKFRPVSLQGRQVPQSGRGRQGSSRV